MNYIKCRKSKSAKSGYEMRLCVQKGERDSQKETYLKKGNLIFLGHRASGKTAIFNKLCEVAPSVFAREIVYLKNTDSMSDIFFQNGITKEAVEGEFCTAAKEQTLIQKVKNAVLIVDSADFFSGKKLELLKNLIRECKYFILTAIKIERLNQTIQAIIKKKREAQTIELSSEQSKDYTNFIFVAFIFVILFLGFTELAILITAGRLFLRAQNTL